MIARTGLLLLALPALLAAQAAVEAAMGAGRAATSTAPAEKTGKAIGAAFEKLNRTLESGKEAPTKAEPAKSQSAKKPADSARPQKSAAATPKPAPSEPQPEVTFEDPAGIQKGMDRDVVIRRFGPPSLTLTTGPGEETLCYSKKDANISVTTHEGKVSSVQ